VAAQGVFHQEAVEVQRREWLGSILVAAPLSRWLLAALALSLAPAIVRSLCFGHYTRRETVIGQLVASAGLLNIAAPSVGTIYPRARARWTSRQGGDVLLEPSSEQDSATLGDTRGALVGQQLDAQRAQLRADLLNQQQLSQQQAAGWRPKAILLRAQLAQLAGQLTIQQQVSSNQQSLVQITPLAAWSYVSAVRPQWQGVVFRCQGAVQDAGAPATRSSSTGAG
jgi:hypothetical protein